MMFELTQHLWDQMRNDLRADAAPQLHQACQSLLGGSLGPLTEQQIEDLESVQRSVSKLTRRIEGEPINWADYSEAAHALRGPLNSTLGFSRLMLKGIDGPINDAQREAIETVYNISRRLLTLFNLLLDALLFAENDVVFNFEPLQAGQLLDELIATGDKLAETHSFSFEADVAPEIEATSVHSDAKRLQQALTAVLATLVKYRGDGAVALRAWLGEGKLLIQLENQGYQLLASPLTDLSNLLTDDADRSMPYDAHLRIGVAWRLLDKMKGRLEARHINGKAIFIIALPIA